MGSVSGPHVTRYELRLAPGIKMSKVSNMRDDLAYALAADDVRILAPIPGKRAVGVEVPNRMRHMVHLGDVAQESPDGWYDDLVVAVLAAGDVPAHVDPGDVGIVQLDQRVGVDRVDHDRRAGPHDADQPVARHDALGRDLDLGVEVELRQRGPGVRARRAGLPGTRKRNMSVSRSANQPSALSAPGRSIFLCLRRLMPLTVASSMPSASASTLPSPTAISSSRLLG